MRWNEVQDGLAPDLGYTLEATGSLVVITLSEPDLLFVTNGHGEDAIACRLARELPGARLAALPLVGEGLALQAAGIEVLGPAQAVPSGGWGLRDPRLLFADLGRGWLGNLAGCLAAARAVQPRLVVGVGDLLPAAFAAMVGWPAVLVGCNKSDYYTGWGESYLAIEIAALRVWGTEVIPRDRLTHERLCRLGLRSIWAGNVMPDLVDPLPPPGRGVALLPGSRADARANLPLMLEALRNVGLIGGKDDRPVRVALAPGLEDLAEIATAAGAAVTGLSEALEPAAVVLGTAGTASEVAAAHGRPIVAFAGPGPQFTRYFAARQKDLLGDAMVLCDRDPAAIGQAVLAVLADEALRARAAAAGRERIGEPGGARAIGDILRSRLANGEDRSPGAPR